MMALLAETSNVVIITMFLLVTTRTLSCDVNNGTSSDRERRALVFPTGTVLQLTVGMSTPASIPNRTLALSFGVQMVFSMPTNATLWHTAPEIMGKREISKKALLGVYVPLEAFLEDHGFDGRTCLLKSICEAAHSPFYHEEMHLLEEIMHAVLTPSKDAPPSETHCSDNSYAMQYLPLEKQYLAAECLGKSDGDCGAAYQDCPLSPLDYISQKIYFEIF